MRVFGGGEAVTQAAMREEETQSWRELTPSASSRFHPERPAALLQINMGSHTSRRGGACRCAQSRNTYNFVSTSSQREASP